MSTIEQYQRHINEATSCYREARLQNLSSMAEYWLARKEAYEEALKILQSNLVIM